MAHRPAMAKRFWKSITQKMQKKMTPERMEEICQILEARAKTGLGLGPNPGVIRGRFMKGPMMAKMRTMSLSKHTGVSVEELEEYQRTATQEMREKIRRAVYEYRQSQKQ